MEGLLKPNNIVIEIMDNNMVKIKHKGADENTAKRITFKAFAQAIKASEEQRDIASINVEIESSPLFPVFILDGVATIQHKKIYPAEYEYFFITRANTPSNIKYYDTVYEKVGMPKLIFCIKMLKNIIQDIYVGAVKDTVITEDTQIYKYPFSNVFSDTRICFGGNRISKFDIKNPVMLHSMPDLFLSMENNNDSYGHANNSGKDYRVLLEELQSNTFNNDWLIPLNKTYGDWFKGFR